MTLPADRSPDRTTDSSSDEAHDLPWYCKAFEAGYLNLYAHRDSEDAERALRFLETHAGLRSGVRLLDLCCGAGRHLALIAPRIGGGAGLDLSRVLLSEAQQKFSDSGDSPYPSRPPLMEADMRALPLRSEFFEFVINLFTSFGYFERDQENEHVLREVARVLQPGGTFAFDHINRPYLEARLKPRTVKELDGGVVVTETRRFDEKTRRVHKDVEWRHPRKDTVHWHESVRLYTNDELTGMFEDAGLEVRDRFGDFDGRHLNDASPRMIFIARRKG